MDSLEVFTGELVSLRPFENDDAEQLVSYLNHPDLTGRRYLPWGFSEVVPISSQQAGKLIEQWNDWDRKINLAIVRTEDEALIGHSGLFYWFDEYSPRIALVIDPEVQGNGYGADAVNVILRYLYEHTVAHNITCTYGDWNKQAAGFHKENY